MQFLAFVRVHNIEKIVGVLEPHAPEDFQTGFTEHSVWR